MPLPFCPANKPMQTLHGLVLKVSVLLFVA